MAESRFVRCAVISCLGVASSNTCSNSGTRLHLCPVHYPALWRVAHPARVFPPCGRDRVIADFLRTADAELRNGAQL